MLSVKGFQSSKITFQLWLAIFGRKYILLKIAQRLLFLTKYVSLTRHSASLPKYFQNHSKSICFLRKRINKSKVVPKRHANLSFYSKFGNYSICFLS